MTTERFKELLGSEADRLTPEEVQTLHDQMEQLTGRVAEAIVYMHSPQAAEDMAAYEAEQALDPDSIYYRGTGTIQ